MNVIEAFHSKLCRLAVHVPLMLCTMAGCGESGLLDDAAGLLKGETLVAAERYVHALSNPQAPSNHRSTTFQPMSGCVG
jgi:hypothetical protein